MSKWTVVNIDHDIKSGEKTGATYVMEVPGGMVVRVCSLLGESLTFVPDPNHPAMSAITIDNLIDKWIEDNKVTK